MPVRDFESLPYYRWYWRDFRASRRVQRMSWQARGLYRELLDECWAKGCIPDDLDGLADICGCSAKQMRAYWIELSPMFESIGNNQLVSPRIEDERTEMDKVRAAKARAGIRSGQSRQQKGTDANTSEHPLTRVPDTRTSSSSSSSSSRAEQSSSSAARSIAEMTPIGAVLAAPDGTGARTAKQWRGTRS